MGLLKAGFDAAAGVLADEWREYFYCDSIDTEVLAVKGEKRAAKRNSNTKSSANLISNGSIIAVNEGQCMIIVDQGQIVEVCAEPGKFVYENATEPSIFYGDLGKTIQDSFDQFGRRLGLAGDTGTDQRIYFFNTKDIIGNKYGTPNPVPFRVVDHNIGLDVDISIRCHGEYSYQIKDPILFYKNICGNVESEYRREQLDSQLKTELLTALQPALAKISEMGIRYSALPAHADDMANALNEVLSAKWNNTYGIVISTFGVSSVTASEEDEAMIKNLQKNAVLTNPAMAAATLTAAQAQAMQDAAKNTATGPMFAFAGMNMAGNAGGVNAQQLYNMAQNQQNNLSQQNQGAATGPVNPEMSVSQAETWTCECGAINTGKFCSECGKPRPQTQDWICSCGTHNTGKFCSNCGKPKQ